MVGAGGDLGTPSTIGTESVRYDAAAGRYTIAGGGENVWAIADHVQYVRIKVSP